MYAALVSAIGLDSTFSLGDEYLVHRFADRRGAVFQSGDEFHGRDEPNGIPTHLCLLAAGAVTPVDTASSACPCPPAMF